MPNLPSEKMISEERLNDALELYEEISEMDNGPLKKRVRNTIKWRATRRRRIIVSVAATVLLPLLIVGGLRLHNTYEDDGPTVWSSESVVLTMSDGSTIMIDGTVADGTVADDEEALLSAKRGELAIEKKGDHAASENVHMYTVYVPKGKQYGVTLEDGTRVWLNSDSRLRFPSIFAGKERYVEVEGELYFHVAKDAEKPFVVEAAGQTITVLGTEFNISAYPEDNTILTTLIKGKVSVSNEYGAINILEPNEQSAYNRTSKDISVRKVDAYDVVAWKDGFFAFDENTLEQVLAKLSRWYDIKVSFTDNSLKDIVFKGMLPKYDDVTKVLDFIEKSGTVKFEIKGNYIIVKR